MQERAIKVNNNILAIEVQLAVSAHALGLDTGALERDLKSRGVGAYAFYGASRTLSPEEAKKRIEVVMGFVERNQVSVNPDYIQILNGGASK